MIRIGIVGIGATVSIAHYHALGYLEDKRCKITMLYDINREGAEAFIKSHKLSATIADSYEEMLDSVDAVSICVPNAFHYQYAAMALKRGKHVLVEKPMGVDKNECQELVRIENASTAVGAVSLVYRFSDAVLKAKEIIEKNFSTIYTISGWFGGKRLSDPRIPFEWRMDKSKSGSGALGDFASHLFDVANFMTGKKIDVVSTFANTFIKKRDDENGGKRTVENDDAAVLIAKSGQTLIQYTVSRVGMDALMMIITGDGGMVQLSLRDGGSVAFWPKDKNGPYQGGAIKVDVEKQLNLDAWFVKQIPAFLDKIEGKSSSIASFEDGLYTEEAVEASFSSSIEERKITL